MTDPGRIRTIAEVTVSNIDGVRAVLSRAAAHIADHLPGTLVWDIYLDEATGQMTMVEDFQDEQALIEYEASMTDQGFRTELLRHAQLERYLVLGAVSDPGFMKLAESLGASPRPLIVSMSRSSD